MSVRVHDPGALALRRAARTAVVMPAVFAGCLVGLRNQQLATFAAFGTMAMLAFADFGGPVGSRIRAYAGLTACGVLLITAGTLLSRTTWPASAGMAAVAFIITFSGVVGGSIAAGGLAALLAFVLAVVAPTGTAELPARIAGWCLAGAASLVAAVVFWPARDRLALWRSAGTAAAALADLIGTANRPEVDPATLAEHRARATETTTSLERTYSTMAFRPGGPTARDQSFGYLVKELRLLRQIADDLAAYRATSGLPPSEDRSLAGAVVTTLRAAAATLEGTSGVIDLVPLELARREHRAALDESLKAMLRRGCSADAVARILRRSFCVRILSYAGLSASTNAALATGATAMAPAGFDVPPLAPSDSEEVSRVRAILRTHLGIESVWCRAGIRAAVALAIAVFIAKLGKLEHGFWVVLGTMSVLKSCVAGTRHTALQALAGTVAGFGVASALLLAGGGTRQVLWAALPICVFLAVYTPTAVHFMIGQAMFTLTVVVLFNLIQPEGWRTGLVRLEDIFVGVATALVVGVLFWPRGARGQLRTSLASLFGADGAYVAAAIRRVLRRVSEATVSTAAAAAFAAGLRADDAFATFLNEPGPKRLPVSTWSELLATGAQLRIAAEAVSALDRSRGPVSTFADIVARMNDAAEDLEQTIVMAGLAIARRDGRPNRVGASAGRRPDLLDATLPRALQSPADLSDADLHRLLTMAWIAEWITYVQHQLDGLVEPLAQMRTVGAAAWWR